VTPELTPAVAGGLPRPGGHGPPAAWAAALLAGDLRGGSTDRLVEPRPYRGPPPDRAAATALFAMQHGLLRSLEPVDRSRRS
jgi:hypothetical protein